MHGSGEFGNYDEGIFKFNDGLSQGSRLQFYSDGFLWPRRKIFIALQMQVGSEAMIILAIRLIVLKKQWSEESRREDNKRKGDCI